MGFHFINTTRHPMIAIDCRMRFGHAGFLSQGQLMNTWQIFAALCLWHVFVGCLMNFDDVCGFSRFMQHPQAFPHILTIKSISLIKSKPQLLQKTPSKSPLVLCTRFGSCLAIMELHSIGRPFMVEAHFIEGPCVH